MELGIWCEQSIFLRDTRRSSWQGWLINYTCRVWRWEVERKVRRGPTKGDPFRMQAGDQPLLWACHSVRLFAVLGIPDPLSAHLRPVLSPRG